MTPPNNTVAGRPFDLSPRENPERARFEEWYTTHAFDYAANPIGSRDCDLQWRAWKAALASPAPSAPADNKHVEVLSSWLCGDNVNTDEFTAAIRAAVRRLSAPSAPPSVAGDGGELPALVKQDQVVRVRYYDARGLTCTAYRTGQEIGDSLSRLATAEQPGSAVQVEAVACIVNGYLPRQRAVEVKLDCEVPEWITRQPGVRAYLTTTPPPAPAAEQGAIVADVAKEAGVKVGEVLTFLHRALAMDATVSQRISHDIAGCLVEHFRTQPEARGVEGMVLVPSGVMKRIERDYEEWGKTAFAAYVRDLLAAEQTESRWNFAGIDLAPDLLRLVGIKNAIGANPDGQACFDSAASELARKMLNEFQKQWTDCAPLNTPNNREK